MSVAFGKMTETEYRDLVDAERQLCWKNYRAGKLQSASEEQTARDIVAQKELKKAEHAAKETEALLRRTAEWAESERYEKQRVESRPSWLEWHKRNP